MQAFHRTPVQHGNLPAGVSSASTCQQRTGTQHTFHFRLHGSRIWQSMAKAFVSLGNQTGEGWFLTGEMLELIHSGVNKHHLHPAVRLPAEPHRRKRRHQRTAHQPSGGEYHRRRLRSGGQRSQPAEPYQTDAFHRTEEPARKEKGVKNWMILD